ncbi:MAG: Ig-like domain-containing protein [Gemmatimonadetes bacterium]|nr:Ig-like domain-containing protein [Gemmatimonadota bacterium]
MSGCQDGWRKLATAACIALGTWSCGGGGSDGGVTPPPPPPVVSAVEVSPATATVEVGATLQLNAVAKASDGTTLARTFTWSSSEPTRASVSGSGLVTAVAVGDNIAITASVDGKSGSATLSVRLPPVSTVTATLGVTSLQPGQTTQATVVLRDAAGNTLTGRQVTWASSNAAVATVNGAGLVTAVAAGQAQITATSEGKSAAVTLTVIPPPVASVALSLPASSISVGTTTQASVVLKDAAGNILTGRTVTFTTNAASVASVDGSGLVTAGAVGTATIMATSEGVSGSAILSVTPQLAEWTVMVFLAADNNLALPGVQDLDEMEVRGSTSTVKVVVQAEYSPSWLKDAGATSPGQINRPNWNTFRYVIPTAGTAPSVPGPNGLATDIGDRDMTSPQELRSFIDWAKQTAPAKRYLLVLWNHGNGPGGLLADETTRPGRLMSLAELRSALSGATPIDIVDFDMCLMAAYETVVALRGVARTAVFSEEVVPGEGNDYRQTLLALQQNATASTTQVAANLVDAFFNGYNTNLRPSLTKSAVNIERSDALVAATGALADDLRGRLPAAATTIAQAVGSAQNFESEFLRDLGDAVDSLRRRSTDPTLTARIDAVRAALVDPSFLLRNRFRNGSSSSANDVRRSRGLMILWPSGAASDALPNAGESSLGAYQGQFPSEPWTAFLGTFLAAASRVPTVDLGVNPLQAYLVWSSADYQAGAEIDLVLFEPTGVANDWDIFVPFLGTVSANGQFTPDSYDSGLPIEGWTAKRFVARGKYYFFAWLYDDPGDLRPFLNVYSRFGYTTAFAPLYTTATRPRLSLVSSWLDDQNLSFTRLFADVYTDMRPVATWDISNAPLARVAPLGAAPALQYAPRIAGALPPAGDRDVPDITLAQRETLKRRASQHRERRNLVPPEVRSRLLHDLTSMRLPK